MSLVTRYRVYTLMGVHPEQPWLGPPISALSLRDQIDNFIDWNDGNAVALVEKQLEEHLAQTRPKAYSDDGDPFDEDEDEASEFGAYSDFVRRVDHIAVMDLQGTLITKGNAFTRMCGMSDYESIRSATAMCALNENVRAMVIDIDSPGGAVSGCALTAKFLSSVDANDMPIFATTGSTMCSAAYWLACGARKITADPEAEVGSIGCIGVHMDRTKQLEDMGIKPTVFRSGPDKALGSPYEPLNERASQHIQDKIDYIGELFGQYVADRRGINYASHKDQLFSGKEFFGKEAMNKGLIDGHTGGEQLVAYLNEQADSQFGESAQPVS